MSTKLIIRKARLEDRERVLDINDNVNDGRDYLSHFYNDFINNHQAFVCQQPDGLVLAFLFLTMVDGGETVVFRGGRVRPSHTGKRIMDRIFEAVIPEIYIPKIKRTAFCMRADGEYYVHRIKKYEEIGIIPALSYVNSYYTGTLSQCVSRQNPEINSNRIRRVDKDMLKCIFHSKSLRDTLFPSGVITVFSVPYKPIVSNVEQIISESTFIFYSVDLENTRENSNKRGLMTVGTSFHCKAGLAYIIDVFGNKLNDFSLHLSEHLYKIQSLPKNNRILYAVVIPVDVDVAIIDKEMRQIADFEKRYPINIYYEKFGTSFARL